MGIFILKRKCFDDQMNNHANYNYNYNYHYDRSSGPGAGTIALGTVGTAALGFLGAKKGVFGASAREWAGKVYASAGKTLGSSAMIGSGVNDMAKGKIGLTAYNKDQVKSLAGNGKLGQARVNSMNELNVVRETTPGGKNIDGTIKEKGSVMYRARKDGEAPVKFEPKKQNGEPASFNSQGSTTQNSNDISQGSNPQNNPQGTTTTTTPPGGTQNYYHSLDANEKLKQVKLAREKNPGMTQSEIEDHFLTKGGQLNNYRYFSRHDI